MSNSRRQFQCLALVTLYIHACAGGHYWGKPLTKCATSEYAYSRPRYYQECVGREQIYSKAAVSSESTVCSTIGRKILEKGGHAVDAAIAVMLCLGVENAESSGLGGGLQMTIYDRNNAEAYALDGREVAPAAVDPEAYASNPDWTMYGAKSIGVPGVVAAMKEAYAKFGLLPWASLFEPAIRLCKEGSQLSFNQADALQRPDLLNHTLVSEIKNDPMLSHLYLNEQTGEPKEEGETLYLHELGRTYTMLSNGMDFYTGPLAKMIVKEIQDRGGLITLDDLKNYSAKWREPLFGDVAGFKYVSPPPPTSGGLVPVIFNILKGFNMTDHDMQDPEQLALKFHRFIEACKFAYAKRATLEDDERSRQYMKTLMTESFADETRAKINDQKTYKERSDYGVDIGDQRMKHSTSHISILDSYGNAVSVTTSINLHFGSNIVGSKTGLIYNDVLNDFSFPEVENAFGFDVTGFNSVALGKRPMSTLSPYLMLDSNDDVVMVGGASGGGKILSTVASVLQEIFIFNKGLKAAVDAPRIHSQWIPEYSFLSPEFSEFIYKDALDNLVKKGHELYYYCYIPSGFNAILVKDGRPHAYTDWRKFGCPDGF